MKNYIKLIIVTFFILILILINQKNINNYIKKQELNKTNKSIVQIIYFNDFKYNKYNKIWLQNIEKTNILKEELQWKWFFINNNWLIITNKHIVNNNKWIYKIKTFDNTIYNAKIIYIDKKNDFSLIKINSNKYKKLDLIKNNNTYIWETIYKPSINNFIKWKIFNRNKNIITTTINLNNWDSWTPLLNNTLQVIGINTSKSNKLNKSYSTLINQIQINQILKNLD